MSRDEITPRALSVYWSLAPEVAFAALRSGANGLSCADAADRLRTHGANELREWHRVSRLAVLAQQVRSPLLLLLVFAAGASVLTGEWVDATIVVTIVGVSVAVAYSREYSAQRAAALLRARVQVTTTVLRDGRPTIVPAREVVPGDVVLLTAGSLVPADALLLETNDFYVSEAVLTGESFPAQKGPGVRPREAALAERSNCVFLGTNVRSGTARCLVIATGTATAFGAIAHRLTLRPPETDFDRGLRYFGYLLTSAMGVMLVVIFIVHMLLGRPPVETLLFALALAVGLSPELLPAILSVNLARSAHAMAQCGVLVRRMNAIENLGSMDVLCTDKTGTLTEGVVKLHGAYDPVGRPSDQVLRLAAWNAALESGIASPLDDAILQACPQDAAALTKRGEIPFDFIRKRVTVIVQSGGQVRMVLKGAFEQVESICTTRAGGAPLTPAARAELARLHQAWTAKGTRVIAVASRSVDDQTRYSRDDERNMIFEGFLTFLDRPRDGVATAISDLAARGVSIKLITGDSRLVAGHIARLVGLPAGRVLTGRDLDALHDEALWSAAEKTDLFVEVDPNQKERIILALKKMGHVVGFLGDGVNDAPAMHAADTSLSVQDAVDVAREAADFVLLERSLDAIRRGIDEGRKTFANTLKYVLMTTSANLGNMASMAVASLFLPFLPLTAGQILLNNFLSDIPAIGLADDDIDHELVDRPQRWDMTFIGRYMIDFGVTSSLFDMLTFAALIGIFHASPDTFRTTWFVESLLTELIAALVMRTRRPFFRSRPGTLLLVSTIVLVPVAFAIPYAPFAGVFGFVPIQRSLALTVIGITACYIAATELQKTWFYRRTSGRH